MVHVLMEKFLEYLGLICRPLVVASFNAQGEVLEHNCLTEVLHWYVASLCDEGASPRPEGVVRTE